ncbi:MAG TPA: glycosyltransferase family 39 protein [Terriglobales bacterium]|jgi:4-amino-4-deoxy-L-arabinose transferase-like glycosyltransferase|nr:glycosyltransferase family 39 protein [Terriglobales bacterium]
MKTRTRTDVLLLVAFSGFLFFYGLGAFGLLGADEPRYAQVAREMLDRHDWITPTLQGKPWLEKPVLYYWQAMAAYSIVGVTDQAARLPAALDAALMIAAIYFFLRRFRPGSEIDGALIAAGCAATIGFARGASTDMPLASMLTIALLGWYAWYETRKRPLLFVFYGFLALSTLAKGPVAIFFAGVILLLFLAMKGEWKSILESLWVPGIALFLAVALPWYVLVQVRNPEFFRVFILQHNLGRFGQDLYHHRQPFWFYLPVLLLALMPWTLWLILAVAERLRLLWSERSESFATPEDSWQFFLLIWMLVPVLFFSVSQSKLPGYILPSVPAAALLVTEYLRTLPARSERLSPWLIGIHAVLCGLLVFAAIAAPDIQLHHRLTIGTGTFIAAGISVFVVIAIAVALYRYGGRMLRPATLLPLVIAVAALLKIAAPAVDAAQSARPVAQIIQSFSHETVPVALFHTSRQLEYGLEFYLNRPVERYEIGQVPNDGHVLVILQNSTDDYGNLVRGRKVSFLTSLPEQKLSLYWVAPAN